MCRRCGLLPNYFDHHLLILINFSSIRVQTPVPTSNEAFLHYNKSSAAVGMPDSGVARTEK